MTWRLARDRRGVTAVEYGVVFAVLMAVILRLFTHIGTALTHLLATLG